MDRENAKQNVIVIGGPSGSGESTITNEILKRYPLCSRLVTATTRLPRNGEREGRDYFFFTKERFLREIESGAIVEYTHIKNRDIYYGSYVPELEKLFREGKTVIVNPDIVGARYYKKHYDALTLFIAPESIDVLEDRIRNRTPDIDSQELEKRLANARQEIDEEQPFYDHTVINKNGCLEEAVKEVSRLIESRFSL